MTRHVALVTDQAYLPWCATAVQSVVDQHRSGEALTIHVVHDGSAAAEGERLRELAQGAVDVELHSVDVGRVAHLPGVDRFGSIVWLRFLLPEVLEDVERVLYLDADVLVTDRLDPILDDGLADAPLAAVANVVPPSEWDRLRSIGLLDPADVLNSGVLLMDLAALRREDLLAQATDAARAFGASIRWPDQDVLNVVFAGRWKALHPRYNVQSSLFEWTDLAAGVFGPAAAEATADPAIVHFEGPYSCKPWHRLCTHPFRQRWIDTLARTPWAGAPLDDDAVTRAIAHLPQTWQHSVYESVVRSRGSVLGEARRLGRLARRRVREGAPGAVPATPEALRPSRHAPHPLSTSIDEVRTTVARCLPYTMGSVERLLATIDATEYVVRRGVRGALVECGVWRGGSVLAMALTLRRLGVTDRDIFLFDTFTGMTEPTADDTSSFHDDALVEWSAAASEQRPAYGELFADTTFGLGQVKRLLHASGYPFERFHFVAGDVEQTIPDAAPAAIALLRLDTDWYASTRHELVHLEPRLQEGGVLIVDDYGHWDGARKAVDEHLADRPRLLLARSDYTGRMAVKH